MLLFTELSQADGAPWHWLISGISIGVVVIALLLIGNKSFGVSSSLRHLCTIGNFSKSGFFKYDLKPHVWSLYFVGGITLGGLLLQLFGSEATLQVGSKTLTYLENKNLSAPGNELYPTELFNWSNYAGLSLIVIGGFLIGFGTRWARGCTSGHSILGISNFQIASLIATIGFFIGGLLTTHFLLNYIL